MLRAAQMKTLTLKLDGKKVVQFLSFLISSIYLKMLEYQKSKVISFFITNGNKMWIFMQIR